MGAGEKLCALAEAHSKWAGWRQQGSRRSWAGVVPEHHFLRDLQAEKDFEGLFYIAKEESWQHGLRRYHWFSAYFNKWAECSRVLAEFAELEKSGGSGEKKEPFFFFF